MVSQGWLQGKAHCMVRICEGTRTSMVQRLGGWVNESKRECGGAVTLLHKLIADVEKKCRDPECVAQLSKALSPLALCDFTDWPL